MTGAGDTPRARLLGISGSLRHASYSSAILATLAERTAPRAELVIHPLHAVPMYNQDEDVETPDPAVSALRDAIIAADAIVIATPEYNHGIPGMLKNALDWASRPRGRCAFVDKAVLYITSSPGPTGGVRAHSQMNETLLSVGARILLRPQAAIGSVHRKMEGDRLVDEAHLSFLDQAIDDLLTMAGR